MKYRKLERSNDMVSALGFGLMRIPGAEEDCIDIEKSKQVVNLALDNGVNFLDSAYTYGRTEHFAGEHILPGRKREDIRITGKLPLHRFHNIEGYNACLTEELRRYRTDYIDYYLVHMANWVSFQKAVENGVLEFLDAALADGRIRNACISIHDGPEGIRKLIDAYDKWVYIQLQYNIIDGPELEEVIAYAHSKGIGVVVMEPLRGGMLGNKLPKPMQKIIDEAPVKRSAAEWAFRYVYSNPAVSCVLSGMNEEAHVLENIAIAEQSDSIVLTEEDKQFYARLKEAYDNLKLVGCTGCRYCQPCPMEIDIPFALKTLNEAIGFGDYEHTAFMYNHILTVRAIHTGNGTEKTWASNCIGCGKCEQACPQHLPIRENLRRVAETFEKDIQGEIDRLKMLDRNIAQDSVR